VSFAFISCEKEEIPVPKRGAGDVTISQVDMGSDYRDQIYYRLDDNSVVSSNVRTIWDLSFESSDEGWHILVNSSKTMKVAFFEGASFEDELNLTNATWEYDASTGNLDSTAVGDWRSANGIYVIDRGYSLVGVHIGYLKFSVQDVDINTFHFQFSTMGGTNIQSAEVSKNKNLNFTQFSFETGVVNVSPNKNDWDLLFTQYTYVFYDLEEVTPYQVTGVLMNRNNVTAVREDNVPFEDIDLDYALKSDLNNRQDVIGYNWKYYLLDDGYYVIYLNQIYIIKDVNDIYYKLHFTDFYTESGLKGAPKFEFQKL
jgi:hypothetical protein